MSVGSSSTSGSSTGTVSNETVHSGGTIDLIKGAATGTTVDGGGKLYISGGNTASNTVLSGGGTLELATSGATLAGTLTFEGGSNTLQIDKVLSSAATSGVTIEGFSSTDKIVVSGATTVAVSSSGGHEIATISSGGVTDTLTFSGSQYTNSTLSWVTSGSAEVLEYTPAASGTTTSVTTSTASGAYTETSGNTLLVEAGGSVSAPIIDNGAFLTISGGVDSAAVISSGGTETISAGSATGDQIAGNATVSAGGTVTSENVLSGGALTINGGADSAATISAHGAETVLGGGSATGDQIFGTLSTISGNSATLTSETVENGGTLNLLNGDSAIGTTVLSGGTLFISGADNEANNTTLSGGGVLDLASPQAMIGGSLTFEEGGNTLEVTKINATSTGDQAVISGFSSTDKIDVTVISATGATLSYSVNGAGNEVVTISGTSGGAAAAESFIFSGTTTYNNNTLFLTADAGSGVDLEYNPNPTTLTVSSGTTSNGLTVSADVTLTVQSGGTASATIVDAGGMEIVSGADVSATISAGGAETVSAGGSAAGDQIYGSAIVDGGAVSDETVLSGGMLALSGGAAASNIVLSGGGVVELASPTATLSGALTFSDGGNTLGIASIASGGDGEQAVISGFSITDQIAISGVGADPTLSFSTSGGNEVVTVGGASGAETLIFSGTSTYTSNTLSLASSGGAVDLEYSSATSVTTSTASGAYTEAARNILIVEQGGSVSAATIESGASLIVSGGADYAAAILAGAVETISAGSAIGDQIYGGATVDAGATVTSETVEDGGALAIGGGAVASNIVLDGGGVVELESPTATLSGSLTFSDGGNTLDIAAIASSGDGEQAVISGFSSTDNIVISGVGSNATLSFATSGGDEVVTVSGASGAETLIFAGTSTYTSSTLSLVTSGGAVDLETSAAPSDLGFQAYNSGTASTISAGPLALYSVAVDDIAPTQMNEGFTEVDAKAAAFDLFTTSAALEADLMGDIEPVVIGPGGQLYLLDGHHTFTALIDSSWGASDPTVYVNVIANYSSDSETQFIAQMEANNWLLPLNDGVPQTVNSTTGAPIPATLTGLTSNVYRGLEYSILKQKDSKLFTTTANITGATGAKTPGLDKMPGLYSDFAEAAAYQDADAGLGLPYLSPGDIALATQWNLNPLSTTTLPNVSGTVYAYQLPGFILSQNVVISASISNATLGNSEPGNGSMEGAIDGNGTFTGITEINAGTTANPIYIDTPNIGLIMQVGADRGYDVTLTNTDNTYIGGTTFLAGTLAIAGDGSLGAAPTESNAAFDASLTFDTEGFADNVTAAVQADNGIIFNSLSEGNGTLTIGTTAGAFTSASPFTTSRVIAVGNEAATVNVNGSYVELEGQLVTLGYDNLGLGETAGFPAFTIDDLSSGGGKTATAGTLVLSTPSPDFYGDVIIGDTGTPTVEVMSDAALGNTTGPADEIGEVELNGGTLQTGASFSASERDINVEGGSQIDVDGNDTAWGSLTDVKRTLAIVNSSSTPGAITFNNLTISQTSTLQLDGTANGTTYSGAESVTFTNGIFQTAASDTLVLDPSSASALGTTEQVYSNGPSATLVDGIAPVWIVTNEGSSSGPYDFVTYGADGYVQESGAATTLSAATGSDVVELAATTTASGSLAAYALNTNGYAISLGSNTLTIGDGTDDAGLILANGSAINGGTLAFGGSQGVVWLSGSATISSKITGGNGLTFAGSGAVNLGTAANVSGVVTIDSGTVTLSAANVFANDIAGVELGDVKSKPSNSILDLTASQTFSTLNSIGSKSAINIGAGDTLTIGDTTNNESSTLSSTITNTTDTAPAIVTAGSGLVDLSGATLTLVAGSAIDATGGELRVATGALTNSATAGSAPNFVLSNNAQLQFAQSEGQYAGSISGAGSLDLVTGTLQLTGANSYTGNTILTTGTTLDVTTANLPIGNDISAASGSLVDFDQTTSGAFGGVISGAGSLDKDDSATDGAGNVTLTAVQTYTGATYVEAGTLTLGIANAVADSSGAILGRVGGGATATLALGANNTLASLSSNASNTTSVALNGHVLTLDPTTSTSSDFGGAIVDGSAAGSLVIDGAGDAELTGANTFTGGTTLDSGTLELGANDSAGTGAITFGSASALLQLDATLTSGATAFANTLANIVVGDQIDLDGLQFESGATTATVSGSTLTVTNGTASETFTLNNPATTNFTVAADNTGGVLLTAATAIVPTITGTVAGQTTTSEAPVTPFAGVTITDANDGGTETDTLSITLSGGGALSGTGLSGSNGSYSLTGTAAAITSQLDALSFTPVDGVPNTSATTSFTLSDLSSAFATPIVDGATTVIDSDPAVAPTITGTTITDTTSEAPVTPFSGVTIADANNGGTDTDTLSITLSGGGALADGASFA
ncbi:MAG: ParB-like protein, partial [Roseiarcus sp.]